jgi:hypothetical protein
VAEYVRFQYLLGDKTFFENVRLLPNGSLLSSMSGSAASLFDATGIDGIPTLPTGLTSRTPPKRPAALRQAVDRRLEGRAVSACT